MENDKKARFRKRLVLLLTLLINLVIVGYIAIREFNQNARDVEPIHPSDLRLPYLLLAVLCFGAAMLSEYGKYRRMIMASEGRDRRRVAFECAVLGKYYDSITPFGAGGQPFQIFYLRKCGISSGAYAAIPIAGFVTLQYAFILLGVIVCIFNSRAIDAAPLIRYSAYVGLLVYAALPTAILLFTVIPKPFTAFIGGVMRLLGKLRIVSDPEEKQKGLVGSLEKYVLSLKIMNKRKHLFAQLFFYSLIFHLGILSVPYFVMRAFGGHTDWWTAFSLVVYIYAAITIIPTPGNSGAAEGSFYAVFAELEGGFLFWAMIIWRLIVYYFWLLAGLILLARGTVASGKHTAKKAVPTDRPPNVAFFVDSWYPAADDAVYGADAAARRVAEDGGRAVVVAPRAGKAEAEPSAPYELLFVPSLPLPRSSRRLALPFFGIGQKKRMEELGIDAIQLHSPFSAGGLGIRLGRKLGVPAVAVFHSKDCDRVLRRFKSKFVSGIVVNYIIDFFCKADEARADDAVGAELLRDYGFLGAVRVADEGDI